MIEGFELVEEDLDEQFGSYITIRVKNIDVIIKKGEEGVMVDLWPSHGQDNEPIASTYAHYSEAEKD